MTLVNYNQQIALLVVGIVGIVAWLLLWSRRPRRKPPATKFRPTGRWFQLFDLKALAEQRVAHLSDAQLTLLAQEEAPQPDLPAREWATRQMAGNWIRFRLRLEPRDGQPWWPVGLTVECPEFLTLRDALPPPEPGQDPGQAVGHVLHLRLQSFAEGASGSLRGSQEIKLVAYVPERCQSLEIGYYGHPLLRLLRTDPGGVFRYQNSVQTRDAFSLRV